MGTHFLLDNLDKVEQELLEPEVVGLLTDADGTLSEISESPEAASVAPEAAAFLDRLHNVFALVGVVSGRRARDVASLVGCDGLLYIGNHGLERLSNGQVERDDAAMIDIDAAHRELREALPHAEGLMLEDKGSVLAIHYRRCRDDKAILRTKSIAARIAPAHGLRAQEGRCVLEIRPPAADKGRVVLALSEEYQLKQVVYLGDDRTDLDAFRALRAAHSKTGLKSIKIAVVADESPPGLKEAADYWVTSVREVHEFLEWLSSRVARD